MMNPLSNLPAYMALVAGDDKLISKKIARKSLLIAFTIVVVVTLSGHFIFTLFGITIDALRIAGGILVGLTGYHMINGVHSPAAKHIEPTSISDPLDVAISPLAMPLFAGPGTIATAIILSHGSWEHQLITILSFLLLCLLTYLLLLSADRIATFLGKNMMGIITRLMGLILTTIGVQMFVLGIQGAFK
ncbi:MarC family protein [Streptococcus didelphis]|nr:MarC family protein [Streptococcus didelphis]WMB29892.1 MarC family protein [Streptococcus didelphis]